MTKGQRFQVPYEPNFNNKTKSGSNAPVGRWKDDIFSCLHYGCCHPTCCFTFFCPSILLAQVMTRLKLNIWALPGTHTEVKKTFTKMLCLFVGYEIFRSIVSPFPLQNDLSLPYTVKAELYIIAGFLMVVYYLTILIRTRRTIREQYAIPDDTTCGVSNDFCCAFWCTGCNVSMMARQTADYDNDRATCFTKTGLQRGVPP